MGDLSPHFDTSEFRDHLDGSLGSIDPALVRALEVLRSFTGPLRIVSGWRSAATNAAVHGAPNSQHLVGRAADIPSGLVRLDRAQRAGFTGIGIRDGWVVHVDTRPGPPVTFHDP